MINNFKDILTFVLIVVVCIGVYQYYNSWGDLQERLDEANAAKTQLEETNRSLQADNERLDQAREAAEDELQDIAGQIAERDSRIDDLERNLQSLNFGTLANADMQATANEFIREFQLPNANISVRDFPMLDPQTYEVRLSSGGTPITQSFLVLPAPYIKLAIEAKSTLVTREEQLALTNQIRGLQDERDRLNNRIIALEEERSRVTMTAYNEAYETFQTIHENYVELLQAPPKVDLAPKWAQLLGGLAMGGVLCSL